MTSKVYDVCLSKVQTQIKRYQTFRRQKSDDENELQDIRDEMSEALHAFGPYYALIRSNAAAAEVERKLAYGELKRNAKKKYSDDKGNVTRGKADDVEADTLNDMKEYYDKELEANALYYKCRVLMERTDQELNSISSRLKLLRNA